MLHNCFYWGVKIYRKEHGKCLKAESSDSGFITGVAMWPKKNHIISLASLFFRVSKMDFCTVGWQWESREEIHIEAFPKHQTALATEESLCQYWIPSVWGPQEQRTSRLSSLPWSDPNLLPLFSAIMSWGTPRDTEITPEWSDIVPVRGRCACVCARTRAGVCVCVCVLNIYPFSSCFMYFMQRIAEYSLIYPGSTRMLLEMHCLSICLKCWSNSVLILGKIGLLPLNWSDNNTPAGFGFSGVMLIPLMLLTNQSLLVRTLPVTIKLKKARNSKLSLLGGKRNEKRAKPWLFMNHSGLPW